MKQLMAACGVCPFRAMCVAHAMSTTSSVEIGSRRYVEVLTGETTWKTGSMPMSGYPFPCCCCLWAGYGPTADNRQFVPYFRDEALCEKAAIKVREHVAKLESSAPSQIP